MKKIGTAKIGTVKKNVAAKSKASRGKLRVAILSWMNPSKTERGLKLKTKFKKSSLVLPLETSRIAKSNGKLVLVINEKVGHPNHVFVGEVRSNNLESIATRFQKSECIGASRIGILDIKEQLQSEATNRFPKASKAIYDWARKEGYHAVVFSALGTRFKDAIGTPFSVNSCGNYIASLSGAKQKMVIASLNAIDKSIETPFLSAFRKNSNFKSKKK